jgi:hydroxypyruvate reductase
MLRTPQQLRDDALAIWRAGVVAVDSSRLVTRWVRAESGNLRIGDEHLDLAHVRRIVVVGAGKAGAGMAAGLEAALGSRLMAEKNLTGWVNVPADCTARLERIRLHGARPAGVNEPTAEGEVGTKNILDLAGSCASEDLCLCLLSGGGSALLPAPIPGITLADKQAVTRHLSSAGANIEQLNIVRKQLSRIKGGGLARACRAGRLVTLIISDVLGDPLSVIASGPTVEDPHTARDALAVLNAFHAREAGIPESVFQCLAARATTGVPHTRPTCTVTNLVIGNNPGAVDAAGAEAARRGYRPALEKACTLEGSAEAVGCRLADMALQMRSESGPECLISGGEPTVTLAEPRLRGRGGRNQQLVLAALQHLLALSPGMGPADALSGILLLSAGTDGEDGPTDAAGAWIDTEVGHALAEHNLHPADFLRRNDAYSFFEPLGALLRTGPTHTNVCDLRVVAVSRP